VSHCRLGEVADVSVAYIVYVNVAAAIGGYVANIVYGAASKLYDGAIMLYAVP